MSLEASIGFMQGRLCAPVDGRIQAFPWTEWRDEFARASRLRFSLMEWTLDADRLDENPLMTAAGRDEIRELGAWHGVTIPSLTGDFLMQAPPLGVGGTERAQRVAALERVIEACGALGIVYLVWPLVDDGRITSAAAEDALVSLLTERLAPVLRRNAVVIAFESDYPAAVLSGFISRIPADVAGINYDTGNSASLGYRPAEEIAAYGRRVVNVHIKDRLRGGTTVPLGSGAADLPAAFSALGDSGYAGRFILQTARASDGDHEGALARNRERALQAMSAAWT
jgi:L-ribulose-5-phosphate 3-epimerase